MVGGIAIALDIITDLMSMPLQLQRNLTYQNLMILTVLFIPVNILWRVKMQAEQKLGLAAFLCLQILMIIIAIVRISGFIYHSAFDEGWVYLWQQIEACVAISTISLTAFRVMFVANSSRREPSPWQLSSRIRRRFFKKNSQASSTGDIDVSIPGGTITGLRTIIGGPRTQHTTTMFSIIDEDAEEWPLRPLPARQAPARIRSEDKRFSLPRLRTDESFSQATLGKFQRIP